MPMLSIERREAAAQPVVFVRRNAVREEISRAIGEGLGAVALFTGRSGLTAAGPPFTRYLTLGPGAFEIEIGMPVVTTPASEGDVQAGERPGGPVVVAVHAGPYDQLTETYQAIARWIEAQGLHPAGAPWESYLTDPAEVPDPADWRTEVWWPIGDQR